MKTIYSRTITIAFICMILQQNIQAQDKLKSKSFIGINIGQSWLGGNVTKNDYKDPTAGFARNPGISFGLDGAYYFHRFIGVGGVFSFSEYGMHSDSLAAGTDAAYGTAAGSAKVGVYKSLNFLVGPYFSLPLTKWLTIDYRVLGGVTNTTSPRLDFSLLDQDDKGNAVSYNYFQNKSTAPAFGFQTGVGLRVTVFRGIALTLKGDYFYSKPNFKIEYSGIQNVSPALRYINQYNQYFSGFNLSLGIAYTIGK
jgi:hypothetical protein